MCEICPTLISQTVAQASPMYMEFRQLLSSFWSYLRGVWRSRSVREPQESWISPVPAGKPSGVDSIVYTTKLKPVYGFEVPNPAQPLNVVLQAPQGEQVQRFAHLTTSPCKGCAHLLYADHRGLCGKLRLEQERLAWVDLYAEEVLPDCPLKVSQPH